MNLSKRNLAFLAVAAATILVTGMNFRTAAKAKMPVQNSPTDASNQTQAKIARAMSAGPTDFARSARIVDPATQGNMVVLGEGSNGFTCMPGNPKVIGEPPMCSDAAAMQWGADFKARKPRPTNTVPGITYMLAGATQRSDSDPCDKTTEAITRGPPCTIMGPVAP